MLGQRYLYNGKAMLNLDERQLASKARLESEDYPFENFACECGATEEDFDVLAEKDRYGLKSRTVICRKCGLVMTNPRMTQAGYDIFYDKEYGKLYRDQDAPDDAYFARRVEYGKTIYDYLQENYDKSFQNVLEIGCAGGGILYYFKEQGCEVTGVDLGSKYIEFGKARGLNLKQCHSSALVKEGKKYDLIIVNHVIEHFLAFDAELEVIHQLLAEDGVLYIEVPGIKDLVRSYNNDFLLYLQNAHVYDFTLGTLEQVMNKYGFSLIVGDESVRSLWKYTGEKKPVSKNYFCETMSFLYQLEVHREARERQLLEELVELNEYLIIDIKLFRDTLEEKQQIDNAWLRRILETLNKEVEIIDSMLQVLNQEKQRLNEEEFNQCMNSFSDEIYEGNIQGTERVIAEMIPMFEQIGVAVRELLG